MKINRCDIYPIDASTPTPGSADYLNSIQGKMSYLTSKMQEHIINSKIFNTKYWFTPQAHSWDETNPNPDAHRLREPSVFETILMSNLGICYGATGIQYFMFSKVWNGSTVLPYKTLLDDDNYNSPIPRYYDSYGNSKWEKIKAFNLKLKQIGNELVGLTWQKSYFINNGTQPIGEPIKTISTTSDSPQNTYIQLGFFKKTNELENQNLDYIYVINRRTLPDEERAFQIAINKNNSPFNNWLIKEIGTNNSWTISKNGSFQCTFAPAEGKLFKLEPVMIAGGTLLYDETLPSNTTLTIKGNIIVQGCKLTLNTNTTLNFGGNNLLIQNAGNLTCSGNSSNKVVFNFYPYNGSGIKVGPGNISRINLNYCIVKNASIGLYINQTGSSVKNTEISNCGTGIYIYKVSPTYVYNENVYIQNCNIHDNYTGIWAMYSDPYISGNTIKINNIGVLVENYSKPYFGWNLTFGNNNFSNNGTAIKVSNQSNPMLGKKTCPNWIGGNNTFNTNTLSIEAKNYSNVIAENNFWGSSSPNPLLFSKDNTSSILYYPFKYYPSTEDPCLSQNLLASTSAGESQEVILLKSAETSLELGNNIESEIIVKRFIGKYPESILIPFSLDLLSRSITDKASYLNYLISLSNKKSKVLSTLAKLQLSHFDKINNVQWLEKVILEKNIPLLTEAAYYEKFIYLLNDICDTSAAKEVAGVIKNIFPNSHNLDNIEILMGINTKLPYVAMKINNQDQLDTINISSKPAIFELKGNYPNPFNPSTTISYSLPEDCTVKIDIYNVMGELVTTLTDGLKNSGSHSEIFNAGYLSSGVYIYRITAKSVEGSKVYSQSSKMILLK